MKEDLTYAYSPTKGLDATREFLAQKANRNGVVKITKEDIIFFNGLGDAISKVYGQLRKEYRVIGPSPAYSTHSSAEASHAGSEYVSYRLDPDNHWYPDLNDLRMKVKYNPSISGILVINPDNPTGAVYPREVLLEIVAIAKEYDLFVVCDEIYINLTYNGKKSVPLADVINGVCGISMKGISKELPWPGARCGWIEVYNADKDPVFAKYIKSIVDDKMLEVCSTTLPQRVIPSIMGDPRYAGHIAHRNAVYEKRSRIAYELLKDIKGIVVNQTNGAFYLTVMFRENALTPNQKLAIANAEGKGKGRAAREERRARQAVRLLPPGGDRHLRGAAHGVQLRPPGFPRHAARIGRREVRVDLQDPEGEDHRVPERLTRKQKDLTTNDTNGTNCSNRNKRHEVDHDDRIIHEIHVTAS